MNIETGQGIPEEDIEKSSVIDPERFNDERMDKIYDSVDFFERGRESEDLYKQWEKEFRERRGHFFINGSLGMRPVNQPLWYLFK